MTYDYVTYFAVARHLVDLQELLLKVQANQMLSHPRVILTLPTITAG